MKYEFEIGELVGLSVRGRLRGRVVRRWFHGRRPMYLVGWSTGTIYTYGEETLRRPSALLQLAEVAE